MKIGKNILRILAAFALLTCVGCEQHEDADNVYDRFEIVDKRFTYNFASEQQVAFIPVKTSLPESGWHLEQPEADWCRVSKSYDNEKGIYLAVDDNEEVDLRTTTFKAVAGPAGEYEFTVRQMGYGPAIIVESKVLDSSSSIFTINVMANIDVRINKPLLDADDEEEWLTLSNDGKPLTRAMVESSYELEVKANLLPYSRTGKVLFTAVDPIYMTDDVTAVCTITQLTGSVEDQMSNFSDKKVTIESGSLSQPSYTDSGIERLFDGDITATYEPDIYHSAYGSAGTTTFPIEMTFRFDTPSAISYFKYYARPANSNGNPGEFDVQYKLAGESQFVNLKEGEFGSLGNSMYDFGMQGGVQFCRFPTTIVNVKEIKLIFYNGFGGFLSGVEIEFYENSTTMHNADLLNVFTDLSCSELKAGVTRREVTELYKNFPYLAQEVAMPMLNGTYPESEKDFRIGTYAAYSNNETIYKDMHTRRYTAFDNPTGIYVTAGTKFYVCVDAVPAGQSVSLGIANDEGEQFCKYDGFNTQTPLFEGLNEITATTSGMCYILNRADVLTSASRPVKVHFLPGMGVVEGYFDMARHTDADYERLLNTTTRKYFVAKGQNMIFLMHSSVLRANVPRSITSGLSAWDDILGWQLELMGLAKESPDGVWDRMVDRTHFNNHMVAISNTNPQSYMDASDYRINFNATSGIPKIITRDLLLAAEDNTWGPAHEAGHVNQRAILWKSNAESSNNLFSNYAIYKFGKYGSRGSKISDIAASYSDPEHKSWVLMGSSTHQNEDTEVHMRLNWQLWNYFHRCGVDPEFWPRLFELMRTKYILPNETASLYGLREDNGKCQLMFAEAVCEAARMDFTDFFEVWGFWEPVDITYEQYGTTRYNVTRQMIDETLQSIASKGYPKAPAVQYIEDRDVKGGVRYSEMGYYTTFRDKTPVTGTPTYTLNGNYMKVDNYSGAVAIEIRGAANGSELGELRYFSNMSGFEIPSKALSNDMCVYAVQWDSKRIEVKRK